MKVEVVSFLHGERSLGGEYNVIPYHMEVFTSKQPEVSYANLRLSDGQVSDALGNKLGHVAHYHFK